MKLISSQKTYELSIDSIINLVSKQVNADINNHEITITPILKKEWDGEFENMIFKGLNVSVSDKI